MLCGQCNRFRGVRVLARTCACGCVCAYPQGLEIWTHMAEIMYLFQGLNTFASCSHRMQVG